jgi:cell division protein FtsB
MRWFAAFGLCVAVLNLTAEDRGLPALLRTRRQAQSIARDIATLKAENATLRLRVEALRDDARAVEIEARRSLGMTRAGELVVLRRR